MFDLADTVFGGCRASQLQRAGYKAKIFLPAAQEAFLGGREQVRVEVAVTDMAENEIVHAEALELVVIERQHAAEFFEWHGDVRPDLGQAVAFHYLVDAFREAVAEIAEDFLLARSGAEPDIFQRDAAAFQQFSPEIGHGALFFRRRILFEEDRGGGIVRHVGIVVPQKAQRVPVHVFE